MFGCTRSLLWHCSKILNQRKATCVKGWYIVLVFCLLVLVFDGVWSYVAVRYQYNYFRGWWGSFLIYAIAGFAAARTGKSGALAAGIVAFVESLFGTVLANALGAYGQVPRERWLRAMPFILILQPVFGAAFGYLASLFARL